MKSVVALLGALALLAAAASPASAYRPPPPWWVRLHLPPPHAQAAPVAFKAPVRAARV